MGLAVSELTLKNSKVQHLLNSKKNFDIVVLEYFFNDVLAGFGHCFGAPVVVISSTGVSRVSNFLVGNEAPSAYIPNIFGHYTQQMDFWQRLKNFFENKIFDAVREFEVEKKQEKLFRKFISTKVTLSEVITNNVSLILANSHAAVSNPVPLVPAIIEIGGFHINPPRKLSTELQKFLDKSKNGVILFSMGGFLKSSDLPIGTFHSILSAFSKIRQNVLWKLENTTLPVPSNIKICDWLPQEDILGTKFDFYFLSVFLEYLCYFIILLHFLFRLL